MQKTSRQIVTAMSLMPHQPLESIAVAASYLFRTGTCRKQIQLLTTPGPVSLFSRSFPVLLPRVIRSHSHIYLDTISNGQRELSSGRRKA